MIIKDMHFAVVFFEMDFSKANNSTQYDSQAYTFLILLNEHGFGFTDKLYFVDFCLIIVEENLQRNYVACNSAFNIYFASALCLLSSSIQLCRCFSFYVSSLLVFTYLFLLRSWLVHDDLLHDHLSLDQL